MTPKCYSYIRFSSPEQEKGDSLRRQLKMSMDYAKEKGLVLDDRLKLRDLGLSAYKGEHTKREAALGRFLALVESGDIPNGSVLLVESLDRLSRGQVLKALDQLRAIVDAGITVVTLADRMEYTQESINFNIGQLMFSLTIMSRAHEESATKARRLKAAWDGKRENIQTKKLTAICPEWLKLNREKTDFTVIEERAEIIRSIYRMKLSGMGSRAITLVLNQQRAWIPKSRKRKGSLAGWRESYVQKILRSPAVIGEYHPHSISEGVRKPIGDTLPDYYPAIVPLDLFHSVQQQLDHDKSLNGNGGGRNGNISNLFGYIAKCGYCGSSMAYLNKGGQPKGGRYLICDASRRGIGECNRRLLRYDEFEELVLTHCRNLNPTDLLPGKDEQESVIKALQGRAITLQGEMKRAAAMVSNLADSIASTENPAVRRILENRLAETLTEQESLQAELAKVEQELSIHQHSQEDTKARLESMRELLEFLRTPSGEGLIDVRRRLRQELRNLIERIEVFPVGRNPMTVGRVKEMIAAVLDVHPEMAGTEEVKLVEASLIARIDNRDLRSFIVYFKGGSIRILDPATPHKLSLEIDADSNKMTNIFGMLKSERHDFILGD